jgi:hypothetical protein
MATQAVKWYTKNTTTFSASGKNTAGYYPVAFNGDGSSFAVGTPETNTVQVFDYSETWGTWSQRGPNVTNINVNEFGKVISLSGDGNVLAVAGDGSQTGTFLYFYNSTSMSWNPFTSLISRPRHVSLNADGSKLAYVAFDQFVVYSFNGTYWNQQGGVVYNYSQNTLTWPISINADGNIVCIGNSLANEATGEVLVYSFNGSSWNAMGNPILGNAENDFFGWSVSLADDGLVLAVNAKPYEVLTPGRKIYTRVYAFQQSISDWVQIGQDIQGNTSLAGFPVSLSGDGATLAIGEDLYNNEAGRVRVFTFNNVDWVQFGQNVDNSTQDITNTNGEKFGNSMSLSRDGSSLVVGAPGVAKAYVYTWSECIVRYLNWVGDGYCDDVSNDNNTGYNTPQCGYDGGDCCDSTCVDTQSFTCGIDSNYECKDPNACPNSIQSFGDGICDDGNNYNSCSWDNGDCCATTCDVSTGNCGIDSNYECKDPGVTCMDVIFELWTDDYSDETTWDITYITSPGSVVLAGGPYDRTTDNVAFFNYSRCLEPGSYNLTIYDSYGDGT